MALFPFPPTGNGNNQPYPLLLIKYELKLPSEATLVFCHSDSDLSSVVTKYMILLSIWIESSKPSHSVSHVLRLSAKTNYGLGAVK